MWYENTYNHFVAIVIGYINDQYAWLRFFKPFFFRNHLAVSNIQESNGG